MSFNETQNDENPIRTPIEVVVAPDLKEVESDKRKNRTNTQQSSYSKKDNQIKVASKNKHNFKINFVTDIPE